MKGFFYRARGPRTWANQSVFGLQKDVALPSKGGKRYRTPRETNGKYNPKRRFTHLEWVAAVRSRALAKRLFLRRKSSLGERRIIWLRGRGDEVQMGEPTTSRCLSGGFGTRLTLSAMKRYYALQVAQTSWPVRVVTGTYTFFSRLTEGLCVRCGNHVGFWWYIGCFAQALQEESRVLEHVHYVCSSLSSLDYTEPDDWTALVEHRARLIDLVRELQNIRIRRATMWAELVGWLLPSVLGRAHSMLSMAVDVSRLAAIAGGDLMAAEARFSVPSRSNVIKRLATVVVSRPTAAYLAELGSIMGFDGLEKLVTSPHEFVLNTQSVKDAFKALFSLDLDPRPVVRYRATGRLGALAKVLKNLYGGSWPQLEQDIFSYRWRLTKQGRGIDRSGNQIGVEIYNYSVILGRCFTFEGGDWVARWYYHRDSVASTMIPEYRSVCTSRCVPFPHGHEVTIWAGTKFQKEVFLSHVCTGGEPVVPIKVRNLGVLMRPGFVPLMAL